MSTWIKKSRDAALASRPPNAGPLHSTGRFQEGAAWQREALLTEEAVERVTRVLFERDQIRLEQRGYVKVEWSDSDHIADWDEYVKPWRDEARAALTAALGEGGADE